MMRRWRKMTWVLLVFSALMLVVVAYSVVATPGVADADVAECTEDRSLTADECRESLATDRTIGIVLTVVLLAIFWTFGFGLLSLIWFITRRERRACPHCGEDVKKGLTACKSCGYDFTIGGKPPATEASAL